MNNFWLSQHAQERAGKRVGIFDRLTLELKVQSDLKDYTPVKDRYTKVVVDDLVYVLYNFVVVTIYKACHG